MTNQENKKLVWRYWQAMDYGRNLKIFSDTLHREAVWHGFHPLRNLHGRTEILENFWQPFLTAFPDLYRRTYLLIGGHFEANNWVCGTGDFIGTFAEDLRLKGVQVPATGRSVHFRFGEFCKVEDGQIVEIRNLIDLPDLFRQAGVHLMPPNYGQDLWIPGPLTGDGVFFGVRDPAESLKSRELVEAMIFRGLNKYDGSHQDSQGLETFWHPHMVWHGPVGIGSTYGLEEFKKKAQGPIIRAFPDRRGPGHQARLAEGVFAASTGWPSLVGTHQNTYMNWPPTGEKIGWNIMDFWRREGDLLLENWNMIDLISAALESGVDLLAAIPQQ